MNNQTLYEILGYLLRDPQAVMPSATFDNPLSATDPRPYPACTDKATAGFSSTPSPN